MKELFDLLETTDEGKSILESVKEKLSSVNSVEAELRTANNKLKQFEGVDLTKLQVAFKYVEDKGGVEAIDAGLAKGAGVQDLEAQAQKDKQAHEAREREFREKYEAQQKLLDRANLENQALPYFSEYNNPDKIMKMALDDGLITAGENGLVYQNGDSVKSFKDGGFEDFKQNDSYKWALKTASGGNVGGGINSGNTGGSTAKPQLRDAFA